MNLKFWKKDDLGLPELSNSFSKSELGLKDASALDLSSQFEPSLTPVGMAPPPPALPTQPSFTPPSSFSPASMPPSYPPAEPAGDHNSKDLEIIAAKLDTIRAQLEMLNARIANLEHQQNQVPPKRPWY